MKSFLKNYTEQALKLFKVFLKKIFGGKAFKKDL